MRFGSLFAGIGGFDLGLQRAGMTPAWQVEIDPWCRRVLAKHWPEVPRHEDVREVGSANLGPVDLVCGGFPCQDLSVAGKRVGLEGDRSGLYWEMSRIIGELRPRTVLLENVHHTWRKWVPVVRFDLYNRGYASVPIRLSAAEAGADHIRRRVFILANPDGELLRDVSRRWCRTNGKVEAEPADSRWRTGASRVARGDDGVSHGMDRRRGLGNSVVPQIVEWIGRQIMEVPE